MNPEYSPKVVGFLCRWCSYTGADLAGAMRLQYPPNIRIIMVPCTGRIDILHCSRPLRWGRMPSLSQDVMKVTAIM